MAGCNGKREGEPTQKNPTLLLSLSEILSKIILAVLNKGNKLILSSSKR